MSRKRVIHRPVSGRISDFLDEEVDTESRDGFDAAFGEAKAALGAAGDSREHFIPDGQNDDLNGENDDEDMVLFDKNASDEEDEGGIFDDLPDTFLNPDLISLSSSANGDVHSHSSSSRSHIPADEDSSSAHHRANANSINFALHFPHYQNNQEVRRLHIPVHKRIPDASASASLAASFDPRFDSFCLTPNLPFSPAVTTRLADTRRSFTASPPPAPSTTADKPPAPAQRKFAPRRLDAFGAARYIASVHVVAGHLVRKNKHRDFPEMDVIANWEISDFGASWVPWFMMLSGFILTYARLNSRNPDTLQPVLRFVTNRVRSIYPLYLCGYITSAMLTAIKLNNTFCGDSDWRTDEPGKVKYLTKMLTDPWKWFLSLTLLQGWVPWHTEEVFQTQCWFLSCIVTYWFLHNSMYRYMKRCSNLTLWAILWSFSLLPWVCISLIPALTGDFSWYTRYSDGGWEKDFIVFLKFNVPSYLHIYVFGMVVAILYVRSYAPKQCPPDKDKTVFGRALECCCGRLVSACCSDSSKLWQLGVFIVNNGAIIGYAVLYGLFGLVKAYGLPSSSLTFRLGALAPLQGLTLVGLAVGRDPLARLFSFKLFQTGGLISYPQYVFQFICFTIWGFQDTGVGYWFFQVALSIVGFKFVQDPLSNPKATQRARRVGLAMIMLLPLALSALYVLQPGRCAQYPTEIRYPPLEARKDYSDIQPSVASGTQNWVLSNSAFDQRFSFSEPLSQDFRVINPSVLLVPTNPKYPTTDLSNVSAAQLQEFIAGQKAVNSNSHMWVVARRHNYTNVITTGLNLDATDEKGNIIYRIPDNMRCQFDRAYQSCEELEVFPNATNAVECEQLCCHKGKTECNIFEWYEAKSLCKHGLKNASNVDQCSNSNGPDVGGLITGHPVVIGVDQNNLWTAVKADKTEVSKWDSAILVGVLDPATLKPICPLLQLTVLPPQGTNNSRWVPCMPRPVFIEKNLSMSTFISTGPEDPRLYQDVADAAAGNGLSLTFHSLPPISAEAEQKNENICSTAGRLYSVKLDVSALLPLLTDPANCLTTADVLTNNSVTTALSPRAFLLDNKQSSQTTTEKNWLTFSNGGTDYFIYSLFPYSVLKLTKDNKLVPSFGTVPEDPRLVATMEGAKKNKVKIHGGSNALLITPVPVNFSSSANATGYEYLTRPPYYLAAFHTLNATGHYFNYLVEISSDAPRFRFLRFSRPLPLLQAFNYDNSVSRPMTFLSGLSLTPTGDILFSYGQARVLLQHVPQETPHLYTHPYTPGSSNTESRALVLSRERVESFFKDEPPLTYQ